jgi:hypothetical protein
MCSKPHSDAKPLSRFVWSGVEKCLKVIDLQEVSQQVRPSHRRMSTKIQVLKGSLGEVFPIYYNSLCYKHLLDHKTI